MPLPKCRWCPSGEPWNDCRCEAALFAQRHGYAAALKKFEPAGPYLLPTYLRPGAGAEPARLPTTSEATVESSEATQSLKRKGRTADVASTREGASADRPERFPDAGPAGERPAHSHVEGTIAPPGVCPWCDRRRENNASVARERRAKQKDDQA